MASSYCSLCNFFVWAVTSWFLNCVCNLCYAFWLVLLLYVTTGLLSFQEFSVWGDFIVISYENIIWISLTIFCYWFGNLLDLLLGMNFYSLCVCFTLMVEFRETIIIFDLLVIVLLIFYLFLYLFIYLFLFLFSDVSVMQANWFSFSA